MVQEQKEQTIALFQTSLFLQELLLEQHHSLQQMIMFDEGNETGIVAIDTVSGGSATEDG